MAKAGSKFLVDNISENDAFVVVRSATFGAIAYHFQRDIGTSSSVDTGAPFDVWRRTGETALPNIHSDPYGADRHIIASDIGSFDYAFYSVANGAWGGSFHGGETLVASEGASLGNDAELTEFSLHRQSLITYDNGDTIDIELTQKIRKNGSFTETLTASSEDIFFPQMFGMEIGSGVGWTQYSLDDGAHWVNIALAGTYALGNYSQVMMRNSLNGQTIDVDSNAPEQDGFDKALIVQTGLREKLYFQFEGGTINDVTLSRTVSFGMATKNVKIESDISYSMATFDTHLTFVGTDAIDAVGNKRDNLIVGNDQVNHLAGGRGRDILVGAGGNDVLAGGRGADTFQFNPQSDIDTVTDFHDGTDTIQFRGLGTMKDLSIEQVGADVHLEIGGVEVVVQNTSAENFTNSDFAFGI